MYIEEGALILGLHDLDHLIGSEEDGPRKQGVPGSEWLLRAMDESGELFLAGLVDIEDDRPIEEQLEALGVERIVIKLEHAMLNPGGQPMVVRPLK